MQMIILRMFFYKQPKEQGFVYVPILIAAIALIGFIFVSSSADFKSKLFAQLFPNKPKSHASETSKIELIGNLGVGVSSLTQTYTPNIQARLTYVPPVPSSSPSAFPSLTPSPVPSVTPSQSANPVITNITPTSGPVDTEITITGINFGSVPGQLAFCCAQPGADVIWSDTQIRTKVPRYARTGVLTVIVGTGSDQRFIRSTTPFTVIQTTATPVPTAVPTVVPTSVPSLVPNPSSAGVGGSVQGVAYAQGAPVLPSGYRLKTGISPVEASDLNGATFVPFSVSEWQAPANAESGYTKVINLQLPGGFGQKYAALQFMVNGAWQQVLLSAPINYTQPPTPSASPTTGEWRTITVPLTKGNSNFNPTGVATIQMSPGIVDTSAGVATVIYKFKFISLQIRGDQPNTWFYPRLCGSVANRPFCADLSQPPTGGQTDSAGNLTFNYPNSSFQYRVDLPLGQTTANLGVFSSNQQAYCGRVSMDSCTLKGTIDLSQLAPATSSTPTPVPTPIAVKIPDEDLLCKADANGDGFINGRDFSSLTPCVGKKPTDLGSHNVICSYADLNNDGTVDEKDVNDVIKPKFGKSVNRSTCGKFYSFTQLKNADVNRDGRVTNADISLLQLYVRRASKILGGFGDINSDNKITKEDADDILRIAGQLKNPKTNQPYTAEQRKRADVNGDGVVTSIDASLTLRYAEQRDKILANKGDVDADSWMTNKDVEYLQKMVNNQPLF